MDVPLRLSPATMRDLGYRAVDEVVAHLATLRDRPVGAPPDREEIEAFMDASLPKGPRDAIEVMREAVEHVREFTVRTDHPRFLAYIPGPSTYVGAVADFLASGFNVFAGQWLVGSGPAVMERITIDWLRTVCGFPPTAGGLFVSGGTMANLIAIHAARTRSGGRSGPVYVTSQTHGSIRQGLGFIGFGEERIRFVGTDDRQRMDPASLRERIMRDLDAGLRPSCVVATAGSTSTGAVDPLDDLADLCAEHGLWLHVDGAYGAAAVLSESAGDLLRGLSRADSLALDPHKWWYQPYEAGCVLVRDETALIDAYSMNAEYLRETRHGTAPLNFYDLGPQLTRGFRALKMWMSFKTFGLEEFRRAVEHGIALAEHAEALLSDGDRWEVVSPAQLAIVTFRPVLDGATPDQVDAVTREIAASTLRDGFALVLTTEIGDRPVLRLCVTHPETTAHDIEETVALLERLADDASPPQFRR
ncbi:pyridoxal phosphate-dependent decarboxylase family protein [Actinomadura chibensis]|uniref:pyridoxal phosphate-dependent decarboxylase family protein n=1 Tax=Actinomadura chibensis TaxID=392828 RepID=UPI000AEC4498|nr:aminotransferase class V-fold PLP-dependent enzyme [Actinomadura chibensis]